MKINLNNIYSPCNSCFIRGHNFDPDNNHCKKCEYNISIQFLKQILKYYHDCAMCTHRDPLGNFSYACKLGTELDVKNCDDFIIDWDALYVEYNSI